MTTTAKEQKRKFNQGGVNKPESANFETFEQVKGNPLPPAFIEPRATNFELARIERTLFSDQEEMEEAARGNVIVRGLSNINPLDFLAFNMAVGKALSNQSYQSGHERTRSGLTEEISKNVTQQTGKPRYYGNIVISLTDLCRDAYGVDEPDTAQKRKMEALLKALDEQKIRILFPNGDESESRLCAIMEISRKGKGRTTKFNLFLHPIYCEEAGQGFSGLPQDFTRRLNQATDRVTIADYRMTNLLKVQDKRQTFIRHISQLLQDLDLEEEYRNQRARVEKKIINLCETQIKTGMLKSYEAYYTTSRRGRKSLDKIFFHLNKDLTKAIGETREPDKVTE